MEFREIKDRGGEIFAVKTYDGVNFPPNVPGNVKDHMEAVKNLKYKEGDIFFGTYPKCGDFSTPQLEHFQCRKSTAIDQITAHLQITPTHSFQIPPHSGTPMEMTSL